jgi:NADH-quinone oxidoreductase subunit I
MVCVRECPTWCIDLQGHPEVTAAEGPGGRDRTRLVLDRFAIDAGLCMFCGICIDVCPFDALAWSAQPVAAAPRTALVEDAPALGAHPRR